MGRVVYEKILREPLQFVKIIHIDKSNRVLDIPKHWHRAIEVIYPKVGYSNVWLNGKIHCVNSDEFLIINSQDIHTFISNESQYDGYAIQIDINFIKILYPQIENVTFINDYAEAIQIKIKSILDNMISVSSSHLSDMEMNGYALVLMSLLLQSSSDESKKIETQIIKNSNIIKEIMSYIDGNYTCKLSPQNIAEKYNFSYGYLSRLFKESTGITLSQYINYKRLEKAFNDLKFSSLNLTEIAMNNGFSDYKSFDRLFSERFKMKPSIFRRNLES